MASHKKFTARVAFKILRNVKREPHIYRNKDVDLSRSYMNSCLADRGFDYYKKRLGELSCIHRRDIITMCGVVVTLPKPLTDLDITDQDQLFMEITNFLCHRYGEKNTVAAIVHRDEAGQPHLHYLFVPATKKIFQNENLLKIKKYLQENSGANYSQTARACGCSRQTVKRWKKYLEEEEKKTEKLCAAEVVNRKDLIRFHPDLRTWLNKNCHINNIKNIGDYFYTGITARQGGNRSVDELKRETALRNEIAALKKQIERNEDKIERRQDEIDRNEDKIEELQNTIDDQLAAIEKRKAAIKKKTQEVIDRMEKEESHGLKDGKNERRD